MHNGVHESLEGTWCIAKPKRQSRIFKQPILHDKASFLTCIQCKSNLVVSTGQDYCCEGHLSSSSLLRSSCITPCITSWCACHRSIHIVHWSHYQWSSFYTTAVWLLEFYPAKIVQTFQWFREQCSFKLIYVPNASWKPLGIAP